MSKFFLCVCGGRGGIVESINVDTQALFSRERERRETDTQVLSCKKAMLLKIKVLLL